MELRELVGVPFVYGGEEISGCDCYGLVKLYYKNFTNIKLEDIKYTRESELEAFKKELENGSKFYEVVSLDVNDLLVFLYNGKNVHFGVAVKEGLMLMSTPKTGSVLVNSKLWSKKVYKILRYKNV
jgi:cell wall-associated NlpC family hydrolase